MQVIGVDPGTGSSSPLGVVLIDFDTLDILEYAEYWSEGRKDATTRIREIAQKFCTSWPDVVDMVAIEYFVMRGKGGETLSRMVGAVIGCLPPMAMFVEVQNTTVKKIVAGHGAGSKEDVADGVLAYFSSNENSLALITEWTHDERWDLIDAVAIAVTAYETRKT